MICFILLVSWIFLNLFLKKKYKEEIGLVKKDEYPLKDMMGIGFWIIDFYSKITFKIPTSYKIKFREVSKQKRFNISKQLTTIIPISLALTSFAELTRVVDIVFIIFLAMINVAIIFFTNRDYLNKELKYREEILNDLPDFLTKISIMLDAGINLKTSIEKSVVQTKKESRLKSELEGVLNMIKAGRSEVEAYETMARKLRIPEITKFVSLVIQNIKKGNAEFSSVIRLYALECWDVKRRIAKKSGEEASAKLVIPLIVILLAVMLVVASPAVIAIYKMI